MKKFLFTILLSLSGCSSPAAISSEPVEVPATKTVVIEVASTVSEQLVTKTEIATPTGLVERGK